MAGATIKIIRRVPEAGGSEMKNAGARRRFLCIEGVLLTRHPLVDPAIGYAASFTEGSPASAIASSASSYC
jgi:hypothetical protein